MSTTTAKRGAGTKFLALLASLTMMIAGLVGVALASPASAAADNEKKVWICHADTDKGANGEGGLGYFEGGEFKAGYNLINVSLASWLNQHDPDGEKNGNQQVHPLDKLASPSNGGWTCDGNVVVCDEGQVLEDNVCVTPPKKVWICHFNGDLGQGQGGEFQEGYNLIEISENAVDTHIGVHEGDKLATWDGEGALESDYSCGTPDVITNQSAFWCADNAQQSAVRTVTNGIPGPWSRGGVPAEYSPTGGLNCTTTIVTTDPEPAPIVSAAVAVAEPAVVEAPAPAPVAAPAPAVVSVPAAATVPAAVPAGGGSQAPGLPMWALALVVVGAIGAAAAGKQILGARN